MTCFFDVLKEHIPHIFQTLFRTLVKITAFPTTFSRNIPLKLEHFLLYFRLHIYETPLV